MIDRWRLLHGEKNRIIGSNQAWFIESPTYLLGEVKPGLHLFRPYANDAFTDCLTFATPLSSYFDFEITY